MTPHRDITDEEWQRVMLLLPELRPRSELRGRPLANTRSVLNGVLWVMYSGASWAALPSRYPSYQTCHRRFKSWHVSGVLKRVTEQLLGAASEDFCRLMEARMRTHANVQNRRAVGDHMSAAFHVPSAVYNPAPAKPLSPLPPGSAASLRHAPEASGYVVT